MSNWLKRAAGVFVDFDGSAPAPDKVAGPDKVAAPAPKPGPAAATPQQYAYREAAPEKRGQTPLMFKVKSNAWLARLKEYCGDNQALYQKLL